MAKKQKRHLYVMDGRGNVAYHTDDCERVTALCDELRRIHASRVRRVSDHKYTLPNGAYGLGLSTRDQITRFMSELADGSGAALALALALALARARAGGAWVRAEEVHGSTREDAKLLGFQYWTKPRPATDKRQIDRRMPKTKPRGQTKAPELGGMEWL